MTAVVLPLQAGADQVLKSRYLEQLAKLGLGKNPALMARIEQTLTPQNLAACREDMRAIVDGESDNT